MQSPLSLSMPLVRTPQMSANVARYMAKFSRAVARPHRVVLPEEQVSASGHWRHNDDQRADWRALFHRDNDSLGVPLTVQTSVSAGLLFQHLSDMRVNFANLLYLEHEVDIARGAPAELPTDIVYEVTSELERVILVGPGRVALRFAMHVRDYEEGVLYRTTRETFFIKKVPEAAFERLQADPRATDVGAERYQGLSASTPTIAGPGRELAIDGRAGLDFGLISGDLNLVHITPLFARMFGHQRPFVQGLYTANLIGCALTDARAASLEHLDITFCRPLYVDQAVVLRDRGERFELVDDDEQLIARGRARFGHVAAGAPIRRDSECAGTLVGTTGW